MTTTCVPFRSIAFLIAFWSLQLFDIIEQLKYITDSRSDKGLDAQLIPAYTAGMDIDTLTIFVEVVRRRSFAAVARARVVDATTISRSIAALERDLDVRLFQRTTRSLQLTEAGKIYFDRIEPLVEELQKARLAAADLHAQPQGVLRIACPVSFAQLNLVPLLPAFAREHPAISFDLVLTDALVDLITEQLDLAIRVGPLEDSTLIAHRLCPMLARVCATPTYLRKHGHPRTPADLLEHRCLTLDLPAFSRRNWRFTAPNGKTTEVAINAVVRSSNAMALKQCALADMGISLQARWMVGRELRDGTLRDVFPDYEVTAALDEADAWLLYPSRRYLPQKVQRFVAYLREQFRDGPPWDRVL
jgi:DNA-binding transcriptional LysR family regulator